MKTSSQKPRPGILFRCGIHARKKTIPLQEILYTQDSYSAGGGTIPLHEKYPGILFLIERCAGLPGNFFRIEHCNLPRKYACS
jgi:hypothetical protein